MAQVTSLPVLRLGVGDVLLPSFSSIVVLVLTQMSSLLLPFGVSLVVLSADMHIETAMLLIRRFAQ